jgi:hypothetical protein
MNVLLRTVLFSISVYLVVWAASVDVFVVTYQEPTLRRKFGAKYQVARA